MEERAYEREANRAKSSLWGGPVVIGILLVLVGGAAAFAAGLTGVVAIIGIGASLGVAGILEIVRGLGREERRMRIFSLLGGLLSLVVGVLFVARPMVGLITLSFLLAAYFFTSGLFRLVTSVADRYPGWGWDLAYGLGAILLGFLVVSGGPAASLWMIGTLVGLEIVFRGITLAAVGFALRRGLRTA